jgi:hypothetical protein
VHLQHNASPGHGERRRGEALKNSTSMRRSRQTKNSRKPGVPAAHYRALIPRPGTAIGCEVKDLISHIELSG